MTQAIITVNGVAGSNDDLPINTLISLTNQNNGGEVSYAWTILDQPPGATDSLTGANTLTPTLTPRKEGSYLIRLVVNQAQPDQAIDEVIVAVRQIFTRNRVPAASEEGQTGTRGWATTTGEYLQQIDRWRADPDVLIAMIDPTEVGADVELYKTFFMSGANTVLLGLPGERLLATMLIAKADAAANFLDKTLYNLIDTVTGDPPAPGELGVFKHTGPIYEVPFIATATAGSIIYLSNTGAMSIAFASNFLRQIGIVRETDGVTMQVMFDGSVGWSSILMANAFLIQDMLFGSSSNQTIKKQGTTGVFRIRNSNNTSLFLGSNDQDQWELTNAGTLISTNGTTGRLIGNVADATTDLQAMNRRSTLALKSRSYIYFGASSTGDAPSALGWLGPGFLGTDVNANAIDIPMPTVAGTFAVKMTVNARVGPEDDDVTFTLHINGSPTSIIAVLPAFATSVSVTASASISDGDRLSLRSENGGSISAGAAGVVATVAVDTPLIT